MIVEFDKATNAIINHVIAEEFRSCKYAPSPESATLIAEAINEKLKSFIKENFSVSACMRIPENGLPSVAISVDLVA